jgi:hypothetical protein
MPFALLIVGIALIVSAVRNTHYDLFNLVRGDFTGPNNFAFWVISILIIGSVGYIPKLKPVSAAFLSLVIIVLFLTKGNPSKAGGGFFEKFTAGIGATVAPAPAQTSVR